MKLKIFRPQPLQALCEQMTQWIIISTGSRWWHQSNTGHLLTSWSQKLTADWGKLVYPSSVHIWSILLRFLQPHWATVFSLDYTLFNLLYRHLKKSIYYLKVILFGRLSFIISVFESTERFTISSLPNILTGKHNKNFYEPFRLFFLLFQSSNCKVIMEENKNKYFSEDAIDFSPHRVGVDHLQDAVAEHLSTNLLCHL